MEKSPEQTSAAWLSACVDRTVNLVLACLLAVPALLVVGIFYVLHLLVPGKPRSLFLYSSQRLGFDRNPFKMYKIRTLREDADYERQGEALPEGSGRELPLGKFLRETRLDELPQLWNVIRGDMNLVGPRPLRPAAYEQLRQELSNCEARFRVKPGLTGYAQFLTPPHTPKRIRIAIDNYYVNHRSRRGRDLFLIVWSIRSVLHKAVQSMVRRVVTLWRVSRNRGSGIEQRRMVRHRSKHIWIQLTTVGFSDRDQPLIQIYDINPKAVSFTSSRELQPNETLYFYLVGCKECTTGVHKKARCGGYVYKSYPVPGGSGQSKRYVVFYEPVSPRHRYLVEHYVLHQTVA